MNRFLGMGRLTADPEIRYSSSTTVASFNLAIDRKYVRTGDTPVDFFSCVCFGKTSEFAEKYLKKGIKIVVEGHLQNDSFTNTDGLKVTRTKIVVDSIEFAESKSASEQAKPAPAEKTAPDGTPDWMNEKNLEDELPFK